MTENLEKRQSPLPTLLAYPSLADLERKYQRLGFKDSIEVVDFVDYWIRVMDRGVAEEFSKIEQFDEEEDWFLMSSHYVLTCASSKSLGWSLGWSPSTELEGTDDSCDKANHLEGFVTELLPPKDKSGLLPRWGHSTTYFDESFFIFGGCGGPGLSRRDNVFSMSVPKGDANPKIQLFLTKGRQPSPRLFHASVQVNEFMFIFGGREGPNKCLDDVHVLDVHHKLWLDLFQFHQMNICRCRHSATFVTSSISSGIVLFGGKSSDGNCLGDLSFLNLGGEAPLTWSELTKKCGGCIPKPRHSHSTSSIRNGTNLVVFGGIGADGFELYNDLFILDLTSLIWTQVSQVNGIPPSPRFSHSIVTLSSDKLLVCGGIGPSCANDVYLLDILVDDAMESHYSCSWSRISFQKPVDCSLVTVRHSLSLDSKEKNILLIGGSVLCFSFGVVLGGVSKLSLPLSLSLESENRNLSQDSSFADLFPSDPEILPEVPEIARFSEPSIASFQEKIYPARAPALFNNCDIGLAPSLWDPAYLKSKLGTLKIAIHTVHSAEKKFDLLGKNFSFETMPFSEAIDEVFNEEGEKCMYIRTIGQNPRKDVADAWKSYPQIMMDFKVPPAFQSFASPNSNHYVMSALRISSKGLHLFTHADVNDNILVGIRGRKQITIWAPRDVGRLYVSGTTSEVLDITSPDLGLFPRFPKAKKIQFILNPGDIVFIPAFWFHHVVNLDATIAINIFWRHLGKEVYDQKDLYGNNDLLPGQASLKLVEEIEEHLKHLPPSYSDYYRRRCIESLKNNLEK